MRVEGLGIRVRLSGLRVQGRRARGSSKDAGLSVWRLRSEARVEGSGFRTATPPKGPNPLPTYPNNGPFLYNTNIDLGRDYTKVRWTIQSSVLIASLVCGYGSEISACCQYCLLLVFPRVVLLPIL